MREERIFSASSYVFTFSASSMPSLFIMTRTRAGSEYGIGRNATGPHSSFRMTGESLSSGPKM